jgi:hypothetical protein
VFKHYFERIQDVEIWPIVSLIIFFLFFLLVLFRIVFMDKKQVRELKNLPFEEGELEEQDNIDA